MNDETFDDEAIENVLALVSLLKRIRARLRSEGIDIPKAQELFRQKNEKGIFN